MTAHKSRTQAEHSAKAHSMMKTAGYAKGGGVKGGPKTVNVIIKTGGDDAGKKEAMQKGLQLGAQMASAQKPPMPPPPGPGGPPGMPSGAMPPGGPPGMPPRPPMGAMPPPGAGGLKKGGVVKVREHVRRKSGGKCE